MAGDFEPWVLSLNEIFAFCFGRFGVSFIVRMVWEGKMEEKEEEEGKMGEKEGEEERWVKRWLLWSPAESPNLRLYVRLSGKQRKVHLVF